MQAYRERAAGTALSAGLATLETPLASEPAAQGAAKTYPTRPSERARPKRTGRKPLRTGNSRGPGGRVVLAARGEKGTDAQEVLARAARDGTAEIAAAAEIDTARLLASQGKTTEAIDRLEASPSTQPDSPAPKDALLFALAQIYERTGLEPMRQATYQRLVTDFPASPYRGEAQQLEERPQLTERPHSTSRRVAILVCDGSGRGRRARRGRIRRHGKRHPRPRPRRHPDSPFPTSNGSACWRPRRRGRRARRARARRSSSPPARTRRRATGR